MSANDKITLAQREWIEDMLVSRQVEPAHVDWTLLHLPTMTRGTASVVIDKLKRLPYRKSDPREPDQEKPTTTPIQGKRAKAGVQYRELPGLKLPVGFVIVNGVEIPRGSYGVDTRATANTNDISFYRLWIGDYQDPRFHERMSMDQLIGNDRVKLTPSQRGRVLSLIASQGPSVCAERFGLEIGKCGICSRTLTNDESRKRGIGPICAGRWGW